MTRAIDRHVTGREREILRILFDGLAPLEQVLLTRAPAPDDGIELFRLWLRRLCLLSVFPTSADDEAATFARLVAAARAGGLAAARGDGEIVIGPLASPLRAFPAGQPGTPGFWLDAWSIAVLADDAEAIAILRDPGTRGACIPAGRSDAFWPALTAWLSTGLEQDDAASVADAEAALAASPTIVEADRVALLYRPLLPLGRALAMRDEDGWRAALGAAIDAHRRFWNMDARRRDPLGLLALPIAGLAALGRQRGLPVDVDTAYLVHPRPAPIPAVTYLFPRHAARTVDDPRWFLDLRGFPREGRRHATIDAKDRLIARHSATGAPGLPRARADFDLGDPPADGVPLALSSRDYRWLSRMFTARAEDERSTPADRAGWRSEADATGKLAGEEPPPDAQAAAMAAIAVLRGQLDPLLRMLATAPDDAIAATFGPRDGDYARAFVGPAIGIARDAYTRLWAGKLDFARPASDQSDLVIHLAPAGMLGDENVLSRPFPLGFRAVADWLAPNRVWACWSYRRPGASAGVSSNGMVWLDDRWVWFPKPFRALAPLADRQLS